MSRGLSNSSAGGSGNGFRALRDYGATGSSGGGGTSAVPDVNFAFSPTEYMSLSENIGQTINSVQSGIHALNRANNNIGMRGDSAKLRDDLHKTQETTNKKIQNSTLDLKRLMNVVRNGDKPQKLKVNKLTSDFKQSVEKYSKLQKDVALKMKLTPLRNASQQDDLLGDVNNQSNNVPQLVQQQAMLRQELEHENSMDLERAQRLETIERDVLDINQIMVDLATMAAQQKDHIETIHENTERTANDVEAANTQLLQAARSQAKYRKKVMFLLLIAVILGLIVTGIIVSSLKN